MKPTVVALSLLALTTSVLATPPACLLAAINTEPNPADLKTICGSDARKVQGAIASACASSVASAAQSAFAATCSSAGHPVPSYVASNGTYVYTTSSFDPSCSCTRTFVTSATHSGVAASTAVPTASGSSTGTGAANGNVQVRGVGSLAAAVIALVGAVAFL